MLFEEEIARTPTAAATQCAPRNVQLTFTARSLDFSPIDHIWDKMKRELTLSPDHATIIAELRQRVQDAWDSLSQDDI